MSMTTTRRLLWLITFAFWQGGFMFYGAVVVPVGTTVLGSEQLQGFVTRSVTNYLNVAGVFALIMWSLDILWTRDASKQRFRLRLLLLLIQVTLLGVLAWLHTSMDQYLDVASQLVLDRPSFASLHSAYLIISTIQWLLSLVLAGLTLAAWRDDSLLV